ncbi:MAG: chemotaxis protein CheD [Proteobacteria bacterium]|nr:chemotaxis protein CheD [Pseudomonadota bacterium]
MATVHVVGISDCKVSNDARDTLVTYALGSCVGVALYDPHSRAGGLLHVLLPNSQFRSSAREFNPSMYADTGLLGMLEGLLRLGVAKHRLVAKLAGGANMLRHSSLLDIGQRNSDALVNLLRVEKIPILASSLGGTVGRSMQMRLEDGAVRIRLLGHGEETL